MSTGERVPTKIVLPPLVADRHLDQPIFHERYEAMPPETRAELVGGALATPEHAAFAAKLIAAGAGRKSQ